MHLKQLKSEILKSLPIIHFIFRSYGHGRFLYPIRLRLIIQEHDFVQRVEQPLQILLPHLRLELTFPELYDVPPHIAKLDAPVQIPFTITLNLRLPKFRVRFWQDIISASLMPMPETPVHEDARAIFLQDDIQRAWQTLHIDTETEAVCEKKFPYNHLRLRILASDARHASMPLFGSQFACHILIS